MHLRGNVLSVPFRLRSLHFLQLKLSNQQRRHVTSPTDKYPLVTLGEGPELSGRQCPAAARE